MQPTHPTVPPVPSFPHHVSHRSICAERDRQWSALSQACAAFYGTWE